MCVFFKEWWFIVSPPPLTHLFPTPFIVYERMTTIWISVMSINNFASTKMILNRTSMLYLPSLYYIHLNNEHLVKIFEDKHLLFYFNYTILSDFHQKVYFTQNIHWREGTLSSNFLSKKYPRSWIGHWSWENLIDTKAIVNFKALRDGLGNHSLRKIRNQTGQLYILLIFPLPFPTYAMSLHHFYLSSCPSNFIPSLHSF